jgi:hypothetical protein
LGQFAVEKALKNFEGDRLEFEREKWQAELTFRRDELNLKRKELNRPRWANPLVIGVFAAAAAAGGNALVAFINGKQQTQLERQRADNIQKLNLEQSKQTLALEQSKSEAARILEVVKTNDPDNAAVNLRFLLDTGLITNSQMRLQIAAYLDKRPSGEGFSLPSPQASGLEGGMNAFERSISPAQLKAIQANLCVAPTGRYDFDTREVIRQAKLGSWQSEQRLFNNSKNEIRGVAEAQIFLRAGTCSKDSASVERGYLTAFEKFRFPLPEEIMVLQRQLNACDSNLQLTGSFDQQTRVALMRIKAKASVVERAKLGDSSSGKLNDKWYICMMTKCI